MDSRRLEEITTRLATAGCVAPEDEAAELIGAAEDDAALEGLLRRRCQGEPLAWLTGGIEFCGMWIAVAPGVYVPRWQSEPLALRAAGLLPAEGFGVDLCTGAGAIAAVMRSRRPLARVLGTEIDMIAAACARANGIDVIVGDLDAGLCESHRGLIDVVTAVVPYVPDPELSKLPRDVLAYEPRRTLAGGPQGVQLLKRALDAARILLRDGGWLLVELGGDQAQLLEPSLAVGFVDIELLFDDDGDCRAVVARRGDIASSRMDSGGL